MRYPANRVISALRAYDAMHSHPQFVTQVMMPALSVELESFFATSPREHVYYFQAALRQQWNDALRDGSVYLAQNLDVHIADNQRTIDIQWRLLTGVGGLYHLQVRTDLIRSEAEERWARLNQRMDAISNYVQHLTEKT